MLIAPLIRCAWARASRRERLHADCPPHQVRLGTYKSEESAPPGAQVARHRQQIDPNDKAQTGERIPFIVVSRQASAADGA